MKVIEKIENIIWISIISVLVYLILPLILISAFKESEKVIAIICILFINVIYSFISSLILTKKYGFTYIYPITIVVIYLICAPLLYTYDSLIYAILYLVISLIGSLIFYKYNK